MLRKVGFLSVLLAASLLAGCGGKSVTIKPDAVNAVKTIALIEAPKPTHRLINLGSPVPLLTFVIDAATGAEKSVQTVVDNNNYAFNEKLTKEITEQLEKSGFKVVVVKADREEAKLLEDYSQVDAQGADAILDVVAASAGYVTEHFMMSPEWRPESTTDVVMYSPGSSEVIYQEKIMYGYHNPLMTATDLDAPPSHQFKSKEDIFADGDAVVLAGLDDAIKSIASQVAASLRSQ